MSGSSRRDFNLKLIELVKKHPCLYSSSNHNQRQAWEAISRELNTAGHICQDYWRKLRNNRQNAIRHNKEYEFTEAMTFLQSHPEMDRTTGQQEVTPGLPRAEGEVDNDDIEVLEDDWDEMNDQNNEAEAGPRRKRKNISSPNEYGAQYFATPVINDKNSTEPINEYLSLLSCTLKDLNEVQMKKFKRRVLMLIEEIAEEKEKTSI